VIEGTETGETRGNERNVGVVPRLLLAVAPGRSVGWFLKCWHADSLCPDAEVGELSGAVSGRGIDLELDVGKSTSNADSSYMLLQQLNLRSIRITTDLVALLSMCLELPVVVAGSACFNSFLTYSHIH
jgi:hypothetical protein